MKYSSFNFYDDGYYLVDFMFLRSAMLTIVKSKNKHLREPSEPKKVLSGSPYIRKAKFNIRCGEELIYLPADNHSDFSSIRYGYFDGKNFRYSNGKLMKDIENVCCYYSHNMTFLHYLLNEFSWKKKKDWKVNIYNIIPRCLLFKKSKTIENGDFSKDFEKYNKMLNK